MIHDLVKGKRKKKKKKERNNDDFTCGNFRNTSQNIIIRDEINFLYDLW